MVNTLSRFAATRRHFAAVKYNKTLKFAFGNKEQTKVRNLEILFY